MCSSDLFPSHDTGVSVIAVDGGYVIACNSISPKLGSITFSTTAVNVDSWVYYARLDKNGIIVGQSQSNLGSTGKYVSKLIKAESWNSFISVGTIGSSSSSYGTIENREILSLALNTKISNNMITLTYTNKGGFVPTTLGLFVYNNCFTDITKVTESDGTISYVVIGVIS